MSLIRDLAETIAGLQVPHSMSGGLTLGKAAGPWRRVWSELRMSGWSSRDEVEQHLREALGREIAEALRGMRSAGQI